VDAIAHLTSALAGHYDIEREIGAGGMATVYLARDVKHDRRVAVKLLNAELGAILGVERFLSEIRVTANLQHPNLLPLFDSGEADGMLYYVMPYVEGESLRARLTREKQLPVEEAVRIAIAVCGALQYAHKHGVIHRDLKPENILLHEGQPLVADFGIALAVSNAGGQRVTQTGLSLGTPQYMSPEQATGDRTIDGRSDIYSLGAVLYEMLVGDPPHLGGTAQAIIAKVLTERPRSVRIARPAVPPHVDAAVDRALEKLPADRFGSAEDFSNALAGKTAFSFANASAGDRLPVRTARPRAVGMVALGVAVAALAGFLIGARRHGTEEPSPEPRFFSVALPDSALFTPGRNGFDEAPRALAISRDGHAIVYSARAGATTKLMLARLDLGTIAPIAGTEDATSPAFSPDGHAIAFMSGSQLQRLALDDARMILLGTAADAWHGDILWGDDDRIYGASGVNCLWAIPAAGGQRTRVLGSECSTESMAEFPRSDWVVITMSGVVSVASRKTREVRPLRLLHGVNDTSASSLLVGRAPFVVAPDLIAFMRDSTMYAARFDPRAMRLASEPQPVLTGIRNDAGMPHVALATDGTLAWMRGGDGERGKFVWADSTGAVTDSVFADRDNVYSFALTNDGKRVAYNTISSDGRARLYIVSTDRHVIDDVKMDLPLEPLDWTNGDRSLIVLVHRRDGTARRGVITWRDGTAALDTSEASFSNSSADGTSRCAGTTGVVEIWKRSAPADRIRLYDELGSWCRFSPDGRYLTWANQGAIYVAPTDHDGARHRVKVSGDGVNGADEPRWSADGRRIYYRNGNRWYVVDAPIIGATPRAPRLLFQGHFLQANASWALGPGGRFLLLAGQNAPPARAIGVITNFPTFVDRKLGKAK
jgi:tRNA A-37 threonylcarbamoyl transferase component Bud32